MKTGNRRLGSVATMLAMLLCAAGASVHAQVNVTTFHNDNSRTGQNTQETILTPANVNSNTFGKVFSTALDGFVFAQPLYLANISIAGGIHNVLYVATEHDSLYAIDADSGALYWQVSLIAPGGSTINSVADLNCRDMVPEVGITGTPVIDTKTGTIYLVARSKVGGNFYQYLHAIDVSTAAEKFGGPMNIQATVAGTATDGTGSLVSFGPKSQNQRAGLLLENGHLVIGWASHCDATPWHGWVMSYNASTLSQEAVYNTSPNGYGDGVWMSAGGLAADAAGDIYFATGNGSWNGTSDLGDSVVKLGPPSGGTFPVVDYFTPYNQASLASNDLDVASGGLTLLPTLPNGKQLLVVQAKEGKIFLVDRNNMGKYCPNLTPACSGSDTNIVQEVPNVTVGVWGVPAYWNGYLYWGPANDNTQTPDNITAFSFNANNSGLISTSAVSRSAQSFNYGAPVPSISANGTSNGILWGVDNSSFAFQCTSSSGTDCQTLYAYDATNLSNLLYTSNQAANYRDVPGGAVKYVTPIIANGKVYFAGQYSVSGYGLISAPVTFNPAGGTYPVAQSVTLADSTPGATIYYTTDGSTPTTSSAVYSGPLSVNVNTTIKAMARTSTLAGQVTSAAYTINTASMTAANFGASANVAAIGRDGFTVPNGGVDGQGYAYSGTALGTTATWGGVTFTLGAAGALDAISGTTLTLPAGNYSRLAMLASGLNGNQVNQVFVVTYTDGTISSFTQSLSDWVSPQGYAGEAVALAEPYRLNPNGSSDNRTFNVYGYNFALNPAKTVKSITLPNNRNVVVLAVELLGSNPPAATPTFSPAAGSFTSAQSVSLADSSSGALIYYTTDGSTPTTASARYTAPIAVSATTTVKALATASGFTTSAVASATYTISVANPSGTPVSLTSAANVDAIGIDGSPVPNGGADAQGYAYSGTALGTTASFGGTTFSLGTAGALNAISSTTLNLPAGNFSKLSLLASGLNGNQVGQVFVVTFTDGTSTNFTQSLSDWFSPQSYGGENIALTEAYRLTPSGSSDSRTFYVYGYTLALDSSRTLQSLTLPNNRNVVVLAVDVLSTNPAAATPTFSPAAGTYSGAQSVSLADATSGALIYYTTDGSTPTTASARYSAPIAVSATTTIKALAAASGFATSAVAGATYTINVATPTATPTFSPAAGTYSGAQSVRLADSTAGALIYYTTDGSTPTTSSARYSAPIAVSASTTIKALATASGFTTSAVASATYTINVAMPAATPTFSPAAGTYSGAQSVRLADSTSGALIYYTTDGSTPTTSSARYSAPIAVSASTTIKALATASGFTTSAVASATYTVTGSSVSSVNFAAAANVLALGQDGAAVTNGGIDTQGFAYSGTLLGTTVNWAGTPFSLGSAGSLDAISDATVTLPAGHFSTLSILATGVNGNQGSQNFVVTYTDGTSTSIVQSLSDWFAPQLYAGESKAVTQSYRLNPDGSMDNRPFYVYGYSFAIDATRTVKNLILPSNRYVVVLAATLSP